MSEKTILEDCFIELHPYGSFPAWSAKDIQNTELPEYEDMSAVRS